MGATTLVVGLGDLCGLLAPIRLRLSSSLCFLGLHPREPSDETVEEAVEGVRGCGMGLLSREGLALGELGTPGGHQRGLSVTAEAVDRSGIGRSGIGGTLPMGRALRVGRGAGRAADLCACIRRMWCQPNKP
eukprot:805761-Pyramimonas_sp.AAC.1